MQTKTQGSRTSYADAILQGTRECMTRDERVFVIGEGVPDPKTIFGTTKGLRETFGPDRVMDMPLSENGMTGILIGTAIAGLRPIIVHQRVDFMLLAMDQIVNNAAKWHFMFNGQFQVPIVMRALIGRGWGQGPQHSQSLQALFSNVPGLKVVMPVTPRDAKGMLIAAVEDNNPVIFLEHRWLHAFEEDVPEGYYKTGLDKARIARAGSHATVSAFSHMVIEALRVAEVLKDFDIELEVIDMRSANPIDSETVIASVHKTGHLAVLDTGPLHGGIAGEVIASVAEKAFKALKKAPIRVALPDHPIPTSFHMANACYPEAADIAARILDLVGVQDARTRSVVAAKLARKGRLDVPHYDFKGPF